MKVLSLTEPYATLIKEGIKTIETRGWKTNYRGPLYIHASSTKIPRAYKENKALMELVDLNNLNYGKIVCSCELVDCILMTDDFIEKIKKNEDEYICGVYEVGRYAWILKDIKVISEEKKVKGKLGIWEYNE